MEPRYLVKVVAIICLTALEIVNLLTARVDGSVLLTLGAIIGGIAGYQAGRRRKR